MMRRLGCLDSSGSIAVEVAILMPVVLLFVLGLAEFGRAIWTKATLDYAVEAAARCAVVDVNLCGSASQTQSYAASRAAGLSIPASSFTVSAAGCGTRVSVIVPFEFVAQGMLPYTLSLTASACYPAQM
jgi:Flp pilus assembly protein TadG